MNIYLENIKKLLQDNNLPEEQKQLLLKAVADADKQWAITDFKLDRTEKVKKTTAILLEETIEELEQKRKAVEAQNKELEIESSLERVRTVAMSMFKPDDLLKVSKIQFDELKQLGFTELRNALVGIFNDDKKYFTDYDYSDFSGGSIVNIPYNKNRVIDRSLQQMKSATDAFTEFIVEGDELEEWKEFRKENGEYDDARINDVKALYYYFYSIEQGNVGISTFKKITDEQLNILRRFRNVFDLSYKRYVDITKAEAQAREARIEASLERIRAASNAMHHSNHLADVIKVVTEQLTIININYDTANFAKVLPNGDLDLWVSTPKQSYPEKILLPYIDHPVFNVPLKDNSIFFTQQLSKTEKDVFFRHFFNNIGDSMIPGERKNYILGSPGFTRSLFRIKDILFTIGNYRNELFSEADNELIGRFAKVFEQAYTRFLDLQKSEAQAREAKIEAALERVRSRSMAMYNTSELQDVIHVVHKELLNLNIAINGGSFIAINKDNDNTLRCWGSGGTADTSAEVHLPLYEKPFCTNIINKIKNEPGFFTEEYSREEKIEFFTFLFKHAPWAQLDAKQKEETLSSSGGYTRSGFVSAHTSIFIINHFGEKFSAADNEILQRFGKVFEQTYIRFLDLQKAEAQAKEAKVEAALEKIRSRSLAMHRSDELKDVIAIMFEKASELNVLMGTVAIWLFNKGNKDSVFWVGNNLQYPSLVNLPYDEQLMKEDTNYKDSWEAFLNGKSYTNKVYNTAQKDRYFKYVFAYNDLTAIPAEARDFISGAKQYTANLLVEQNSSLYFDCWDGVSYSEESIQILRRFAKVFEQSYIRFLDLQKAEAQARESQIELALERVRARTMAMQKSDELPEISALLFQQAKELGVTAIQNSIGIVNEDTSFVELSTTIYGSHLLHTLNVPADDPYVMAKAVAAWKAKQKSLTLEFEGQELKKYNELRNSFLETKVNFPEDKWIVNISFFSKGWLSFSTSEIVSAEIIVVLKRFAAVFEQTYTRFLDLQKAEAQAREAQIEAALERVRSRSMAMHKSDELLDAAEILFVEMQKLGIESLTAGYVLMDKDGKNGLNYTPNPSTKKIMPLPIIIPHNETIHLQHVVENWKKSNPYFIVEMNEDETIRHQTFIAERSANFPLSATQLIAISPAKLFLHNFYFKEGYLLIVGGIKLSAEQTDIMLRFTKVFQQTYTRFLDLQKAEAQAREAQIEAALERVRSRSMGMQKSEELSEVIQIVHDQFVHLDIPSEHTGFVMDYQARDDYNLWIADRFGSPSQVTIPYFDSIYYNSFNKAKESGIDFFITTLSLEEKNKFYEELFKHVPGLPEKSQEIIFDAPGYSISTALLENISLYIENFTGKPFSDEENAILIRFGKVFQQTYTRFLDLQKAEAQARESQIELSLERVRAKTMAMHNSQDVADSVVTLFNEVVKLGIDTIRCGIGIGHDAGQMELWTARPNANGKADLVIGFMDMTLHPLLQGGYNGWKNKEKSYTYELKGDDLINYYTIINNHADYPVKYDLALLPKRIVHDEFYFPEGSLYTFSEKELSADAQKILHRFAAVFGQTYRRYLDLKKAEMQARESQIETALERVRAIAMSMMKSDQLLDICEAVFKQLLALGFEDMRAAQIYIRNDNAGKFTNYDYSEITGAGVVEINYDSHPNTRRIYDVIRNAGDALIHNPITKEELEAWKSYLYNTLKQPPEKSLDAAEGLHYYLYSFGIGAFGICTFKEINNEALEILKRFRNVFNLSYQRYTDISMAEAQTKEAQIETGLERVRSRTLAMQKSDELAETAAVLFKQLIVLGIAPNRLYIGVIKNEPGAIEFWVTDEDGSKVSTMFTGDARKNTSMKKMYDGWKQKKSIIIDMQGKELADYFHYLGDELHVPFKDGLLQKRRIQTIAYFSRGLIGIASPDEQPNETVLLLERFAGVFNLTFTRFNDLQIAEAHAVQAEEDLIKLQTEKKRAEDALTELQVTQKQLVQSEKMASLGELTAGIAHEIQNPLNFVNNFSEVSKELLDEMKAALDKGDIADAEEIARDVIQNLEKINHHGKRADAIVKGMLQHSRATGTVKEPIDINALTDEYIRLCYHGLRAKDKSFNSTIKTDFDASLEKVNIIPQDIGRVILNIMTNAFYAVNERKNASSGSASNNYEPTVTVSTSLTNASSLSPSERSGRAGFGEGRGEVIIKVSDNGSGIPKSIVDKIFQPFFTTKPTGQGTGLGLSLCYDIIKAHDGTIKVESKENEGTSFIIQLPVA